jgi:hypothetical protein
LNFANVFELCNSHGKCSQSTGSTASFEINGKIHGKSNYILLTMGLLLIASHSPLLQRQV